MWSQWLIQTYARVIGDRGEMHVINPTSPQLWHRMRVKSGGNDPHREVLTPADLRVPTRGVLRGGAARRANPDPTRRLDRQHARDRRDLRRRGDDAARDLIGADRRSDGDSGTGYALLLDLCLFFFFWSSVIHATT